MITLRYHITSIAAVFLAIAVGVVLGSTTLSRSLLSGITTENSDLGTQVTQLEQDRNALNARLADGDSFAGAIGPLAVRGALDKRTVVLITTADAHPADRDAVKALVTAAGGSVTGELQLTDAFADPAKADQLKEIVTRLLPAGVQLPTVTDPGTLAGGLLGPLLLISKADNKPQASPEESAAALAGLTEGGFLAAAPDIAPAQLAVVLTGGASTGDDAGDKAATIARFATQVDRAGAGTVLTGGLGSAEGSGAVGVVRADTAATSILSTVDNVDTPAGRVVVVLALAEQVAERAGRYGSAGNAQAAAPGAPAE
ncbi:copper transporter [Actinokineospora cianjurensis]|uniref:Copper transport outer membrane protein MctB n=1 Tax=Actinokineospora cianjurensis TaxID=585224 RepID=A0A421AY97_9PSEU|nr:copper transporter [Actinokineospora cianjurensis]RLK54764.1 copper transport outer membrane protein MctB [Actinokineospora cianjurensis]